MCISLSLYAYISWMVHDTRMCTRTHTCALYTHMHMHTNESACGSFKSASWFRLGNTHGYNTHTHRTSVQGVFSVMLVVLIYWVGICTFGGVVGVVIIELDVSEGEGPTPKCECDWTSECHKCHVTVIRPLGNGVGDTGRRGQAWYVW